MSKRSKVQEAERQWRANLSPEERSTIPPAELRGEAALSPERARLEKQFRERERQKYRAPRIRAPRGSVLVGKGKDRTIVPEAVHKQWQRKLTAKELREAPRKFAQSYFAGPTDQDFYLACTLRTLLEELSGFPRGHDESPEVAFPDLLPEVPQRRLKELRAAWEGAFGPIEDFWEGELQRRVWNVLPSLQAGGRPALGNGASILNMVKASSPPHTVPKALTAASIDKLLNTSTVTRGGGTKGRTKNADAAIRELISAVKAAGGGTQ